MTSPDLVPRNVRSEFRTRLATFAEDHPELNTREAAQAFGQSLPEQDRELVSAFLSSEAETYLLWELRAQFSRTRQGIFAALDVTNPDRPAVAQMPEQSRETLFDRITKWREFVPSENRTAPLIEMTRPKLRESADYDASQVEHYGWKMILKKRLADGMPDDDTEVRAFYTPDQIATLGEQIKLEMNRGNFRLAIKPVRTLPRTPSVPGQVDGRHAERPEADRGLVAS